MTNKDYQAIARALHAVKPKQAHADFYSQWQEDVSRLAFELKKDNPRFDGARFIEACEAGTTKGMRKTA